MSFFSKILVKFGTKIHFLSQISPCTPLHFAKIHQHGPTTFGVGRTKVGGGVQKSIFLQKKWIFRWSVTEIHQHGPTTFGVGRKKFAKIHFFTEKFRVYTTFYRNSSARTHKIWGRTKKFAKIHFFTEKISALLDLLQKFVRRPKRPKKGNCYHYTYKGCYLFIFTK